MMHTNPKGFIGEVVGYNAGWSSSQAKRAVICGVTKTTVSIMVGDKRVTFNRNTWYERGSKNSRFAAYLVNEATLLRDQARYKVITRERELRQGIANRLAELSQTMTFAQWAESYANLSKALEEIAESARAAAFELHQLEATAETARQAVSA